MSISKKFDIDWYCDSCNALMNNQTGFKRSGGWWTCAACGFNNDVSLGNTYWDDDSLNSMTQGELNELNKAYDSFDKKNQKKHDEDFLRADYCRGGELTEED